MSDANPKPSESSVALDQFLKDAGEAEMEALSARFHRTMLWKLRTGRRGPELETAVELERLTGGKVSAAGWLNPVVVPGSGEHPAAPAATGTDGGKA